MQITLIPCERKSWEQFRDFHYQKLPLSSSAKCHLAVAEIDGVRKLIGFYAATTMHGKYDTLGTNAYRAHKTVVRMLESPAMFKLWAFVSDAQAQHYVAAGVKFYSQAPIRYAAYRDNPDSNWVPTCKDKTRSKSRGERSHEYKWVATASDKKTQKKKRYRSHEFVRVLTARESAVEMPGSERAARCFVRKHNAVWNPPPSGVGESRMQCVFVRLMADIKKHRKHDFPYHK